MSISLGAGSAAPSSAWDNPQILSALLPNYNISALVNAMQSELTVDAIPISDMSQQVAALQAQESAWQQLQTDLANLQNDAQSLGSATLYQQLAATSSDPNAVTASVAAGATGTPGSYQVAVTQLARPEIDRSNAESSATAGLGYSGSFTVNGQTVDVSSTDSLDTLAQAINAADAGVTATVLTSTGGGTTSYYLSVASDEGNPIQWGDPNGILASLGLPVNGQNPGNLIQTAQQAQYTINGIAEQSPSNTDSTSIPGVTLDLVAVTSSPVTVTLSQNQSAVVSALQQLATDYNTLLGDLAKYTGKGGVLEGNAAALGIADTLQSTLTAQVAGQPPNYAALAQIGVNLSAPVGSPDALSMSVNTAALQSALAQNPTAVATLLDGAGGIATLLAQALNSYVGADGAVTGAISSLQSQIGNLNNEINDPNSAVNMRIQEQQQALQAEFEQMINALLASQAQGQQIQGFLQAQYVQALGFAPGGGGSGG